VILAACSQGAPATTLAPPAAPVATPDDPLVVPPVGSGEVTVHFGLDAIIGDKPPTLVVTVDNAGATAVPLPRLTDPGCFVFYNLRIARTPPKQKPAAAKVTCARDAITDGVLAAGTSVSFAIPLGRLFDPWDKGVHGLDVDWDQRELAKVKGDAAVLPVGSTTNAATRFAIADVPATVRADRDQPVKLPGGVTFVLTGHGHKHVMTGGPPSPLIVHGTIAQGKAAPVDVSVNVHVEESKLFRLEGDHVFELVDYAYDEYMTLRYFGRLPGLFD